MKHLLSWQLVLSLAAAAMLGGCRTVPKVPDVPDVPQPRDPMRVPPKPRDPTLPHPKPRALAPELQTVPTDNPAPAGYALAGYGPGAYGRPYPPGRPYWREPGPPWRYAPRRPWREPGYLMPRPRPMPMPRPYTLMPRPAYPERWQGGEYIPNPGLRRNFKPGQRWGSPGDTLRPRLEYRPMGLSNKT